MGSGLEKRIGSLLVIVAVIWAAYHLASVREFEGGYLRLGPMQLLLAGLMVWLHGRYRESVHANRA